jgi:hypothetical protein
MSAPPAALKDARHHWSNHTDECQQANHWEKPAEDDVGDDDPVERQPWRLKMSMESLLCHNSIFPYSLMFQ